MVRVPTARYFNLFGPTETNVCTFYEVKEPPAELDPPVPIGRGLLSNTPTCSVLDEKQGAQSPRRMSRGNSWCTVRLWLRGTGANRGVTRRASSGLNTYRTGDIVYWSEPHDDPVLRFVGRRDHMVKTRGYRFAARSIRSLVDCVALAIETPVGVIIHTGDFKIDLAPLDDKAFDLHTFAEYGKRGVLALFQDSTNVERPGYTPSERAVIPRLDEILTQTKKKLFFSCFSSSIYRIRIAMELARKHGRKVAVVGRWSRKASTPSASAAEPPATRAGRATCCSASAWNSGCRRKARKAPTSSASPRPTGGTPCVRWPASDSARSRLSWRWITRSSAI